MGLGNKIAYYSSLARMANFFAVILLVSVIGISIWIIMAAVGKRWASWEE
jgi:NitT/TauT family transport system permease protein